jgi:hypothetical protein
MVLKDRKWQPEGVEWGPKIFFQNFLAAVPKSPPKARTKYHDVHDPTSEWMFLRNTAGHHKRAQNKN